MKEELQSVDLCVNIFPVLTNASVQTGIAIDTKGFRAATIRVLRCFNTTTADSGTLRLLHSDTGLTATDHVTLVGAITIARVTVTPGTLNRYEIDLKGCKRYFKVEYTGGTHATITDQVAIFATLYRPEAGPTSAAGLADSSWTASTIQLITVGMGTATVT